MFYQNNNDYMRDAFYYSQPQNSTYQYNGMNSYSPTAMGANNMYNTNNAFNTNPFQTNQYYSNMSSENMNTVPMNSGRMNTGAMSVSAMNAGGMDIGSMSASAMNTSSMNTGAMSVGGMNTGSVNANSMNSVQSISNFYPQVYRIIDPVASRVISNNNYSYYTEDNINNMVDTVYNIVEGDISTLTNTEIAKNASDDNVTQGPARGATATASSSTTRQNGNTETTRTTTVTASTQSIMADNQLLKDLIKIIIIMKLLERQKCMYDMQNTYANNMNQNCYDSRMYMNF